MQQFQFATTLLVAEPDSARHSAATVPSAVPTLAGVEPGERVEVCGVLRGVGETAALLRAGDVLTCRGRTAEWLVVELPLHGELAVHRSDARLVHVARSPV